MVNRTETSGLFMIAEVHCGDVAQIQVGIHLGSPTAILVEVGHAQFIYPHRTLLGGSGTVTHTHHNHTHIAQRWITHHGNHVVGVVGVRL